MLNLNKRAVILISLLIIALATITFSLTAVAQKNSSVINKEIESYNYILVDFNGRPTIFESGKKEPIIVLDMYTSQLPPKDQERIISGITGDSLEEILTLAENYE